jgi:predicted outer membrane repeat protein
VDTTGASNTIRALSTVFDAGSTALDDGGNATLLQCDVRGGGASACLLDVCLLAGCCRHERMMFLGPTRSELINHTHSQQQQHPHHQQSCTFKNLATGAITTSNSLAFAGTTLFDRCGTDTTSDTNAISVFQSDEASRALVSFSGSVTFSNCASLDGGALFVGGYATATFEADSVAVFESNRAESGGAIFVEGINLLELNATDGDNSTDTSNATLPDTAVVEFKGASVTFKNNIAEFEVVLETIDNTTINGTDGFGGALRVDTFATVIFSAGQAFFTNNSAPDSASALYVGFGAVVRIDQGAALDFQRNTGSPSLQIDSGALLCPDGRSIDLFDTLDFGVIGDPCAKVRASCFVVFVCTCAKNNNAHTHHFKTKHLHQHVRSPPFTTNKPTQI